MVSRSVQFFSRLIFLVSVDGRVTEGSSPSSSPLVGRDAFFVLDLGLHVLDCVARLDLECDRFAREHLDKDLHSTTQTQDRVQDRLLLDVVVAQSTTIFQLFSSKDKTLLAW